MTNPMMACGHAANATSNGKPSCVLCAGFNEPAAHTVVQGPDLSGRIMKCSYNCGSVEPSSTNGAFFQHHPEQDSDEYYCGCYGWN